MSSSLGGCELKMSDMEDGLEVKFVILLGRM